MPRISVVIPAYNASLFIAETIDSVIGQKYHDWECIVVNDGSTDDTAEIVAGYCARDSRIRLISQPNGRLSSARNKGIKNACGEFILPLDADDKIGPDYMRLAMEEFDKNPDTKLVYCNARLFGTVDAAWPLPEYSYERLIAMNCIFCTSFFRKKDAVDAGLYDESFRTGYEDWDFLLRLIKDSDRVVRLKQEMFFYRKHGETTIDLALQNEDELLRKIAAKYPGIYNPYKENVIRVMRGNVNWNEYTVSMGMKKHSFINKLKSIFANTGDLL